MPGTHSPRGFKVFRWLNFDFPPTEIVGHSAALQNDSTLDTAQMLVRPMRHYAVMIHDALGCGTLSFRADPKRTVTTSCRDSSRRHYRLAHPARISALTDRGLPSDDQMSIAACGGPMPESEPQDGPLDTPDPTP